MIRRPFRLTRAAVAALLVLLAIGAVSCAKKPVSLVDPALAPPVYPEGRAANTNLILYPDTPVPIELWQDDGEVTALDKLDDVNGGGTAGDHRVSSFFQYETGSGAVVGMIIDSTDASQYQIFKRQSDGGFLDLLPYTLKPTQSWTTNRFDAYQFSDPHPYAAPLTQYIGRGVVDGLVTTQSPLTNLGDLTIANVPGRLKYLSPVDFGATPATTDSLIPFKWQAVPGAAGYYLTMYGLPSAYLQSDELFRNALPRPVMTDRIPVYFAAWFPASVTSYTMGDPVPAGTKVITSGREVVMNARYAVRIAAVDANGEMIDYTGSTGAYVLLGATSGQYYRFPLGAVVVRPTGPLPPPELAATPTR